MHVIEMGLEATGLIMLAIVAWTVFVCLSPYRPCRWCRNRRPGRRRRCWRCKGTRHTRRIGAKTVHKVKLSVLQAWEERP